MIPVKAIQKELYERSYYDFFIGAWDILEPTNPLDENWHIKYLCDLLQAELERIIAGRAKTQDIIINIPPRTLKSSIVTVLFNAWVWARYPHIRFISCSYSGSMAMELSVKTRRVLESTWYQSFWADKFNLCTDQNVKSFFENDKSGFRKAVGAGGSLTGSGCDIMLIDDILNPEQAHSDVERENANRWYKETAYSRLNNPKTGVRIIIMQRLHEDDLTGWCLKNQPKRYNQICIPATDDGHISPPELSKYYDAGYMFPSRLGKQYLDEIKAAVGSYGYAGQYMQSPSPLGGGMFRREWFRYYSILPKTKRKVWAWDTAVKAKSQNDYTCGILISEGHQGGFYIEKVVRLRLEYPEVKRLVLQEYQASMSNAVLIEDKSSGQELIQEFKRGITIPLIPLQPLADKITRASIVSPSVEAGNVLLSEGAQWVADFIHELTTFPNSRHDDQVDAFVYALDWLIKGAAQYKPDDFFSDKPEIRNII